MHIGLLRITAAAAFLICFVRGSLGADAGASGAQTLLIAPQHA
jgi:hypothetical protein